VSAVRKGYDGRYVCQVVGCDEPAEPWGRVVDVDELEIEVVLCRRHERESSGMPPERDREGAAS